MLTFAVLTAFATIVGVLATRQIRNDFNSQVAEAAKGLRERGLKVDFNDLGERVTCTGVDLSSFGGGEEARVRVVDQNGRLLCGPEMPDMGPPTLTEPAEAGGYRIESAPVPVYVRGQATASLAVAQYARPLSEIDRTVGRVKLMLLFGVVGGAGLALLAGLALARRAMAPLQRLTETAREVERTRDPGRRIAIPEAEDEVAELARTLDRMLRALDAAQTETEHALNRQRAFVADASHELRTPLTSVLANLELLAAELQGEPRVNAESALRSTQRMRRLVADLLLLARADAGRQSPRRPVDLAQVAVEVAVELAPLTDEGEVELDADETVRVSGAPDELHRLVLNLVHNAMTHTPPETPVRVAVDREEGWARLAVEDEGPGIPVELRARVFDRFARGTGDSGGSGTGLGLAIVRAVAEAHGGTVELEDPRHSASGARFVVRLPLARVDAPVAA